MKIKILKINNTAKIVFGKKTAEEKGCVDQLFELIKKFCTDLKWENGQIFNFRRLEFRISVDQEDFDSNGQVLENKVLEKLDASYWEAWLKRLNPRRLSDLGTVCPTITTNMNKFYILVFDGEEWLVNSENY